MLYNIFTEISLNQLHIYTFSTSIKVTNATQTLDWRLWSSHQRHEALADSPCSISRQSPVDVITTGALPNSSTINPQRNPHILVIWELASSSNSDLAASIDGSTTDANVIAILQQDRIIAVISQIHGLDDSSTTLGNAKDSTTASSGIDLIDIDVGVVVSIGVLTIIVSHSEGSISIASSDVVAVNETDPSISGGLEEQSALSDITSVYSIDVQSINVPCLYSVASSSVDGDSAHLHVVVPCSVSFESNAHTTTQVQVDGSQSQSVGSVEAHSKVRSSGHCQIRNLGIGRSQRFNGASTRAEASVESSTDFKDLSGGHCNGTGTDRAGGHDTDSLAGRDAVKGGLNGEAVVAACVESSGAANGGEST